MPARLHFPHETYARTWFLMLEEKSRGCGVTSGQVPDEEAGRILPGLRRHAAMPGHARVERLLGGAECIEQIQCHLPVVAFVVPLEQDVERYRHLPCLFERG